MKTIIILKPAFRLSALAAVCLSLIAAASAQTNTTTAPAPAIKAPAATNTIVTVTNSSLVITNGPVVITNGSVVITITNGLITISNAPLGAANSPAAPSGTNAPATHGPAGPAGAQVVALPKPPPPPPKWDTSAAVGLTLTRGNSKTELFTANVVTQKKTPQEEYFFGGDAAYGENNGQKNTETLHGFGQYNNLFDDRVYWGIRGDANHDGIADIRYRLTLAPLLGYFLIKRTNTTLAAEVGPAIVYQDQGDVTRGTMTLRGGQRFEHKFTARTRLWETFEILPQVDRFSYYVINAELGIEAAINEHFSLRTYLDDTYYSIPAPGRLKNDAKFVTALAFKF